MRDVWYNAVNFWFAFALHGKEFSAAQAEVIHCHLKLTEVPLLL